ncbi:hypothetical protein CBR_g39124 [Chara braunii]|uniref:CCHC-type domain-containing protein n=1 Tax=Chara braunii TaxID=69332 RepID=A0A388LQY8_CHABU|nr:hypothetical protein CBR_g39124 [Chara braunii]|eukprot:GBG84746.1 hypothetical protein CBR_g39124 [Chara braunii]
MERGSSSHTGHREDPHRFAPVCYECGEPGHYRNQCPKLGRDGSTRYLGQRERSISSRQRAWYQEPRAAFEDPGVKHQLEELAASFATMKEAFDVENTEREEKRKRRMEKLDRKKREEEKAKAMEEAHLAEKRRATRKEENLRKEEEDRKLMRKEMLMEISLHMGQLDESLRLRYERDEMERSKGKQRVVKSLSDDDYVEPYESDVDTLSRRGKIPTSPGSVGKLKIVTENLRELRNMIVDELKRICLSEESVYEGKKMEAILAIVENRTQQAYGEEELRGLEQEMGDNPTDEVNEEEVDAESDT